MPDLPWNQACEEEMFQRFYCICTKHIAWVIGIQAVQPPQPFFCVETSLKDEPHKQLDSRRSKTLPTLTALDLFRWITKSLLEDLQRKRRYKKEDQQCLGVIASTPSINLCWVMARKRSATICSSRTNNLLLHSNLQFNTPYTHICYIILLLRWDREKPWEPFLQRNFTNPLVYPEQRWRAYSNLSMEAFLCHI